MRHLLWLLCTIAGPSSAQAQDNGETSAWTVRMSRMQGAAEDIRRASEDLEETAYFISNSGGLRDLVRYQNQLDALSRLVISARMAIDVAAEDLATD